jgi:Na+/melibiose symporter-like transporter
MVWRIEEAGMGVFISVVVVVAVILLVNKLGDWFDMKTGWVVGAIIAGLVTIYLMAVSATPTRTRSSRAPPRSASRWEPADSLRASHPGASATQTRPCRYRADSGLGCGVEAEAVR